MAQQGGASGLIVVSDMEDLLPMARGASSESSIDLFVVSVTKSFGDQLVDAAGRSGELTSSLYLSFALYAPSVLDLSEAFILALATSMVVAGAWFATADMRQGSPVAPRYEEEIVEVTKATAFGFCALGSLMLVILFFLMDYLIWVVIFGFCFGGGQCLAQLGGMYLAYTFPPLRTRALSIPQLGHFSRAELISAGIALVVVVAWFCLRNTAYSWPLQDIIGAGFLCMIQRTVRITSMKVATVLLSIMFFFDIFWVFISPLIFRESVMVKVATGGNSHETVPLLFRIPKVNDPFHTDNMLGFGDIAVPGLLVSFLRRHDILSGKRGFAGYFAPSVVGYAVGLCATLAVLMLSKMGQPALLYLVPGTLGTTWALACKRGEAARLWEGASSAAPGNTSIQAAASSGGYPLAATAPSVQEAQGQELQRGLAEHPHGAA